MKRAVNGLAVSVCAAGFALMLGSGCALIREKSSVSNSRSPSSLATEPARPGSLGDGSIIKRLLAQDPQFFQVSRFEDLDDKFQKNGLSTTAVLVVNSRSPERDYISFKNPRVILEVHRTPDGLGNSGKLFLGYAPGSDRLQVISWDPQNLENKFYEVTDFRTGGSATLSDPKQTEQVCLACHQNRTPLFWSNPWENTNQREPYLCMLKKLLKVQVYQGIKVDSGQYTLPIFTGMIYTSARRQTFANRSRKICGSDSNDLRVLDCRRLVLAYTVLLDTQAFYGDLNKLERLYDQSTKQWGLSYFSKSLQTGAEARPVREFLERQIVKSIGRRYPLIGAFLRNGHPIEASNNYPFREIDPNANQKVDDVFTGIEVTDADRQDFQTAYQQCQSETQKSFTVTPFSQWDVEAEEHVTPADPGYPNGDYKGHLYGQIIVPIGLSHTRKPSSPPLFEPIDLLDVIGIGDALGLHESDRKFLWPLSQTQIMNWLNATPASFYKNWPPAFRRVDGVDRKQCRPRRARFKYGRILMSPDSLN